MIQLKDLTIGVNNKIIIKNINFSFKKNKLYALMGPNGSGKSTLAYTIAGHPHYQLKEGEIIFNKKLINDLSADKRAKMGIFLSFQSPLSLSGVSVFQLLRLALSGKEDPLKIKEKIEKVAKKMDLRKELIEKSLNEEASGGERKKIELLQAAVINPKFLIFDEIDTGVDIDSLKVIAKFLNDFKKNKTIILITHYYRILKLISPDEVLVLKDGQIVKTGDHHLALKIEKDGYNNLEK